jgi:predicted transcriptional regulator
VSEAIRDFFGAHQAHRAFPVVKDGRLLGIVDRTLAAGWLGESAGKPIGELCASRPPQLALMGQTCRSVATRLARERLERLPVVKDAASMELVGLIARSDLIKPSVIHFEEEEKRERLLGLPWQAEP